MIKPLVSVIVPVYNCESFIEKCLKSIVNQDYENLDIIVINDGSTDNSGLIIKKYADYDKRINYIEQENEGVCSARNNAVLEAKGDYLLFIDGDDYIDSSYVSLLVNKSIEEESDLVICGYQLETVDKKRINVIIPKFYREDNELWAYRISAVCSRLYDKRLWDRLGLCFTDEKDVRGEDVPVSFLANYGAKKITIVQSAGYHYVQHPNSAMHKFKGMKTYSFPKKTLVDMIVKADNLNIHNNRHYLVFGILKLFAQFEFQLMVGMSKQEKYELNSFFSEFLDRYCVNYYKSWKYVKHNGGISLLYIIAIELFLKKIETINIFR